MPFDADRYINTKFVPRTFDMNVPMLKEFFDEGEKPIFRLQGLTGQEIGQCKVAPGTMKDVRALMDGLMSSASKEKADAVKDLFGINDVTPDIVIERLEQFKRGCVDPVINDEVARKICHDFGVKFWEMTNKILELSGLGFEPGKQVPSGVMEQSEPA